MDLSTFIPHEDAPASLGDSLSFATPPGQWHYAIRFPCPLAQPSVIEIDAEIVKGEVGFGLNNAALTAYVSGEATGLAGAGRQTLTILAEETGEGLLLVARNYSGAGERSEGRIYAITVHPAATYDSVKLKRMRAHRHAYWHYSYDLGDGVKVEANLKGGMDSHILNQQIVHGLLDRAFPNQAGVEILDAACSSGFLSFGLARKGMRVTAIDLDQAGIEQAQFVQSCMPDEAARSVNFQCVDLLSYSRPEPFPLFLCSGLFYHLRDLVGGAAKLYRLATEGGVVHSCYAAGDGDFMELADHRKYMCCFDGEFSFVPSIGMLNRIFRYVGFRDIQMFKTAELCSPQQLDALRPNYADLFRNKTAYWILKKG